MIDLTGRAIERREYADRVELDAIDLKPAELALFALRGEADIQVNGWIYPRCWLEKYVENYRGPTRYTFRGEKSMLVSAEQAAEIIRKGEYVEGRMSGD